jgi:hypothetical protein
VHLLRQIEGDYREVVQMLNDEIDHCRIEAHELQKMVFGVQNEINSFLKNLPAVFHSVSNAANA